MPAFSRASYRVAAFAVAIPFIRPLAGVFDFVALPWTLLAATIAIVVGYSIATEPAKGWFFRDRLRTGVDGGRPIRAE